MFSDNFVKLCARKGIHPTTVAEILGYSRTTGSKWCNGATPRKTTLQKIADYFGVTVDALLEDETKKAPVTKDERRDVRQAEDERKLSMLVSLFERLSPEDQNDVLFDLLQKAHNQLDQGDQQ